MHTLHMHWHVHVLHMLSFPLHIFLSSFCLPSGWCLFLRLFHLSLSLYLCLRFSRSFFSGANVLFPLHPSVSLPPCSLALDRLTFIHNPCCSQCLHLFAKPIGFLENGSKAQGLPSHPQQLPPTLLSGAQQPLVSYNERAAELLRWDLRLVTVYSASQRSTVIVVSLLRSQLSSGKGSLVLGLWLKYAHVYVFL